MTLVVRASSQPCALPEVIAASTGKSASSKKVLEQYEKLLGKLGSEFDILRKVPTEDIKAAAGAPIAEGIKRLREGRVERAPGFDGEYGTISLLTPSEISSLEGQLSFLSKRARKKAINADRRGRTGRAGPERSRLRVKRRQKKKKTSRKRMERYI